MIDAAGHVEKPLGAEFHESDAQVGITVHHAAAEQGDERHLRRQRHAQGMGVEKSFDATIEGRETCRHMHAKRQLAARKLIPKLAERFIAQHFVMGGAEHHRRRGPELEHFLQRGDGLARVAQRNQAGPFETFGKGLGLARDEAVEGAKQRRFEARVGGPARIERRRKKKLHVDAQTVEVANPRLGIDDGERSPVGSFDHPTRRIRRLQTGSERVRLHPPIGQPTSGERRQLRAVVNQRRPRPPRGKLHGHIFPHLRRRIDMGVGIVNSITVNHKNPPN